MRKTPLTCLARSALSSLGAAASSRGRLSPPVESSVSRERPLVQHLPSLIVDKARKLRQVLCLLELGLNIPGTVLHLLVEDVHRVLIQSEGDAADPNGRGHQHDHDDQHDHQRRKDGDKDGVFFSFCFISHQKLHGLSLLSLVFVPSQPSYWRRASQRL